MNWHASADLLERYRDGSLPRADASSVDAHVLVCPHCRAELAAVSARCEGARLDAIWEGVVDVVDAPRPGFLERILLRLGVPGHIARLLAATPSLQTSWLVALAVSLAFAVAAARGGNNDGGTALFLFLVSAPLLPVAGTAAAFGPRVEPVYELAVAAPMHGFHLLLIRSLAVLATTTLMAGIAALALPQASWEGAAWVLPALGLTAMTLVLAARFSPVTSAAAVTGAWLLVVAAGVGWRDLRVGGPGLIDDVVAFRPAGQAVFLALTVVAVLVLISRRDAFEAGHLA